MAKASLSLELSLAAQTAAISASEVDLTQLAPLSVYIRAAPIVVTGKFIRRSGINVLIIAELQAIK
jgi:hypothetical protein